MNFFLINVFDKTNSLFCISVKNLTPKTKNTEGVIFLILKKIFITKNNLRNTKI